MEVQYTISSLLQSEVLYLKARCDVYGFFLNENGWGFVLSLLCLTKMAEKQVKQFVVHRDPYLTKAQKYSMKLMLGLQSSE